MRRLVLVPLVALSFLSACNGDDAPSREEFAKDAERICTRAQNELRDLGREASSPDELAGVVDGVIDRLRQSVDELGDLEPPDGEAGEAAERFVDAVERDIQDTGIPALREFRDAVEEGDRPAAEAALRKLQEIDETDTNALAREIGAPACGE
jgi:hypothetical protein